VPRSLSFHSGVAAPLGIADIKVKVYSDHAPVLAVSGQVPHSLIGAGVFQEIDAARLFESIAPFSQLLGPRRPIQVVNSACYEAIKCGVPAHVSIPADVLRSKISRDDSALVGRKTLPLSSPQIRKELVDRAADLLTNGKRRLIVVGDVRASEGRCT
jgi:pyruvate oxidase